MSLSEARIKSLIENNVWTKACPVSYSELTCLDIAFINFEGCSQIGQLFVATKVAEQVSLIFQQLYNQRFPMHKIQPMDVYNGNDIASMQANNTSAFNGRKIMNTDRWSSHAYGVAIDINPVQNPFMMLDRDSSTIKIYPEESISYVNRGVAKKGMVEEIVSIFAQYGFSEWGGNWDLKPDYHHFQIPWGVIKEMFPDSLK